MMLKKTTLEPDQISWFNFEDISESEGTKTVIQSQTVPNPEEALAILLSKLGNLEEIAIAQPLPYANWGGLMMDTEFLEDTSTNPFIQAKEAMLSEETKMYLDNLESSGIEWGFTGLCSSSDMGKFIAPILEGVGNRNIMYCPRFISKDGRKVLFFHHSGDIVIWEKG